MMDELDRVLEAWRLSPGIHYLPPPAIETEIALAEKQLGRQLPDDLRRLYEFSNGMEPMAGNLQFDTLVGGEMDLVGNGDRLRSWQWPIPHDLLVFGGNGSDDLLGLWHPQDASPDWMTPVVMVGAIFEERSFALAGTDLVPFLRAWSGYYLQISEEAPVEALDALGLPKSLRPIDDPKGLAPYFQWADPMLPDHHPDPYARGMTELELADLIRSMDLLRPRG